MGNQSYNTTYDSRGNQTFLTLKIGVHQATEYWRSQRGPRCLFNTKKHIKWNQQDFWKLLYLKQFATGRPTRLFNSMQKFAKQEHPHKRFSMTTHRLFVTIISNLCKKQILSNCNDRMVVALKSLFFHDHLQEKIKRQPVVSKTKLRIKAIRNLSA